MTTNSIIEQIDIQIKKLEQARALLANSGHRSGRSSIKDLSESPIKAANSKKMSAAGRARIAAAQKARWAASKRADKK